MADRMPTLWETYEMMLLAVERGQATIREAREFHRLMLVGPNGQHAKRFMSLAKKLSIGPVPEGSITPESLLAWAKDAEAKSNYTAEVVSETVEEREGKKHLEVVYKFTPKPRQERPSKRSGRRGQ